VAADLPRDLELICLKCLKVAPHDRYPAAAELGADLSNWLDGKPISARPAGVIEQATKWARRNQRLAVMGAAALLTMAAATAVSLGFGLEANRQADVARGEKAKADAAAERADRETHLANASAARADREKEEAQAARLETQRTLVKALLGPVAADKRDEGLTDYERDVLWRLSELRDGPVPLMAVEEATRSRLGARQLECRAEFLLHAAVGLDSAARRTADRLLTARLTDPNVAPELKGGLSKAAYRQQHTRPRSFSAR
jgi:hypothetical protein